MRRPRRAERRHPERRHSRERLRSCQRGPSYIHLGLPRSGSSLVERILSSHSAVASAGELDCFALGLTDAARRRCGRAQIPRQELVAISATLDFPALGRDYLERARAAFGGTGRFIDKMPLELSVLRTDTPRAAARAHHPRVSPSDGGRLCHVQDAVQKRISLFLRSGRDRPVLRSVPPADGSLAPDHAGGGPRGKL